MSIARIIFRRETSAAFFSRSRYLFFASFFAISSALFCSALQFGEGKFWTLQALWTLSVAFPLPIFVSLITMPLFAGERAAGTFESLTLLPIPLSQVVHARFFATWFASLLAIVGSLTPWFLICHTLKRRAPDSALLFAPLVILMLHTFSWTALGTLSSALSRRPWLAAVGTIVSGIALILFWAAIAHFWLGGNWLSSSFPLLNEILDAAGGTVRLSSVAFHLLFGTLCLFIAARSLEANR